MDKFRKKLFKSRKSDGKKGHEESPEPELAVDLVVARQYVFDSSRRPDDQEDSTYTEEKALPSSLLRRTSEGDLVLQQRTVSLRRSLAATLSNPQSVDIGSRPNTVYRMDTCRTTGITSVLNFERQPWGGSVDQGNSDETVQCSDKQDLEMLAREGGYLEGVRLEAVSHLAASSLCVGDMTLSGSSPTHSSVRGDGDQEAEYTDLVTNLTDFQERRKSNCSWGGSLDRKSIRQYVNVISAMDKATSDSDEVGGHSEDSDSDRTPTDMNSSDITPTDSRDSVLFSVGESNRYSTVKRQQRQFKSAKRPSRFKRFSKAMGKEQTVLTSVVMLNMIPFSLIALH